MPVFSLDAVPPFRLDLTVWALRRRPTNEIDRWDGACYERVLMAGGRPVLVGVTQTGDIDAPRLEVAVSGATLSAALRRQVTGALHRLLGVHADLRPFYHLARGHRRLDRLAQRFRGLKPPRFATVWEGIANGIACQQLSLAVGIALLNRLSGLCGAPFECPSGKRYAFPIPESVAAAAPAAVQALGFSGAKTRALQETARRIAAGELDLESTADLDNRDAVSRLLQLRGVGRWTAEYTLLRGMGRIDVFPGDDIGARNNLARWMSLREPLDYDRVARVLAKWKPYAGLIYFHLLLDGLARAGYVSPADPQPETLL